MLNEQVSDPISGVGPAQPGGGRAHRCQAPGVPQQAVDFERQPLGREVRVGDNHSGAGVDQTAGIGRLMVVGGDG
jgi:hypothetical protein